MNVPWGCLRFVFVVFPDHTHLLLLANKICLNQQVIEGYNGINRLIFTTVLDGWYLWSYGRASGLN